MWAKLIEQPTDIHSPDGKMEICSFFFLPLSAHLPHRLISQLIPPCEGTVLYSAQEELLFSWVLFACPMLEDRSGNSFRFFSLPDLLLIYPINLLRSVPQLIYFHCNTSCHHSLKSSTTRLLLLRRNAAF